MSQLLIFLTGISSKYYTFNSNIRPGQQYASCGKIMDNVTVAILGDDMKPVALGSVGELHVGRPLFGASFIK
jgi:hypothetical protein